MQASKHASDFVLHYPLRQGGLDVSANWKKWLINFINCSQTRFFTLGSWLCIGQLLPVEQKALVHWFLYWTEIVVQLRFVSLSKFTGSPPLSWFRHWDAQILAIKYTIIKKPCVAVELLLRTEVLVVLWCDSVFSFGSFKNSQVFFLCPDFNTGMQKYWQSNILTELLVRER